ncbi:hypothetical protein AM493_11795 [Flavobacterium akiainvivens]|uniref:Uncharacterized protein n=1 Tax=Flavobacterium akiainvivens TaxID=1202724 RepID=A0A0M8MJ53_9FLAO|nr:hypothetical protein AM493_11795 [Flavobacterium akiainvivens]
MKNAGIWFFFFVSRFVGVVSLCFFVVKNIHNVKFLDTKGTKIFTKSAKFFCDFLNTKTQWPQRKNTRLWFLEC